MRARANAADTRALERMLPPGEDPNDYVIGSSSGLPVRKLPSSVAWAADPRSLLDALAAIATRATKSGGLPADMADRLDALADAAREHTPVIEHPTWCDRGDACRIDRDEWDEGVISVYHETVLFELVEGDTKYSVGNRWCVELMQVENYLSDGSVERGQACLYVDVPPHNDGLHGVQLERFTRAVAAAGHLAAGSPPASPTHPDVARCGCETCLPSDPTIRVTRGPVPD